MPFQVEIEWLGRTFVFPDVEGVLEERVEFFGGPLPEPRTFPMECRFAGVSVADAVAAGDGLDSAVGRVYLAGELMLEGRLKQPVGRYDDEPVAFAIAEDLWGEEVSFPGLLPVGEDRGEFGGAVRSGVDGDAITLPLGSGTTITLGGFLVLLGDIGAGAGGTGSYPFVAGQPGRGGLSFVAPRVYLDGDNDGDVDAYLCIALGEVDGTAITLEDSEGVSDSFAVTQVTDLSGRVLSVVDQALVEASALDETLDIRVRWDDSSGPYPTGAGDLLRILLRSAPYRIDYGTVSRFAEPLNAYTLDTYTDEPVPLLELVEDLLDPLPACIVQGRGGMYVWVWDPDAAPVGHLRVSTLAEVTGVYPGDGWQLDARAGLRSTALRYALDSEGRAANVTHSRGIYHRVARLQRAGSEEVTEAPHIYDPATAQRCADLRIRALGRPPVIYHVRVLRELWGYLRAGDPVLLTWVRCGVHARRAVVTAIADSGDDVLDLEVTVPQDPMYPGESP